MADILVARLYDLLLPENGTYGPLQEKSFTELFQFENKEAIAAELADYIEEIVHRATTCVRNSKLSTTGVVDIRQISSLLSLCTLAFNGAKAKQKELGSDLHEQALRAATEALQLSAISATNLTQALLSIPVKVSEDKEGDIGDLYPGPSKLGSWEEVVLHGVDESPYAASYSPIIEYAMTHLEQVLPHRSKGKDGLPGTLKELRYNAAKVVVENSNNLNPLFLTLDLASAAITLFMAAGSSGTGVTQNHCWAFIQEITPGIWGLLRPISELHLLLAVLGLTDGFKLYPVGSVRHAASYFVELLLTCAPEGTNPEILIVLMPLQVLHHAVVVLSALLLWQSVVRDVKMFPVEATWERLQKEAVIKKAGAESVEEEGSEDDDDEDDDEDEEEEEKLEALVGQNWSSMLAYSPPEIKDENLSHLPALPGHIEAPTLNNVLLFTATLVQLSKGDAVARITKKHPVKEAQDHPLHPLATLPLSGLPQAIAYYHMALTAAEAQAADGLASQFQAVSVDGEDQEDATSNSEPAASEAASSAAIEDISEEKKQAIAKATLHYQMREEHRSDAAVVLSTAIHCTRLLPIAHGIGVGLINESDESTAEPQGKQDSLTPEQQTRAVYTFHCSTASIGLPQTANTPALLLSHAVPLGPVLAAVQVSGVPLLADSLPPEMVEPFNNIDRNGTSNGNAAGKGKKGAKTGGVAQATAPIKAGPCGNCGAEGAKMLCTGCRKQVYCSRPCAIAAWKSGHKNTCTGAKKKM